MSSSTLYIDNIYNKAGTGGPNFSNGITTSNVNGGQLGGMRNLIINGNFDVWQRGTSQTSSGYGSVDRWSLNHGGSSKTASQELFTIGQTEVPGNPKYYLRQIITSDNSAGGHANINTRIEDVSTLSGKTATLSFWAKSDANRNIASELFQRFGTGGTPSTGVNEIGVTTHSLTTSWQKFTVTISIPSISGKTLGTDGNNYLGVVFWLDAGTDYDSRTNSLGNQSGTFDITQVQLEVGSTATPFEHRPYGTELALCQRYYFATTGLVYACGYGTSPANYQIAQISLPTVMRSTPTVTLSDTSNGSSFSGGSNNTETIYYSCTATVSAAPRANMQADAEL